MFTSPRPVQTLDARFWMHHLWLPLLLATATLYLFEHSSLDIALADFWYRLEGGTWALRKNWFSYDVMHHWGKRLIIGIDLTLFMLYAASWKVGRLRPWRWSLAYSITAIILLPAVIAFLKHLSSTPCPWDLSQFGGTLPYMHNFQYTAATGAGHCFPAGHSSGGFALLALYFAFSPFLTKNRYWLLLPGLVTGVLFGLAQQLRGAHFISHDIWSATISWFGALLLLTLAWRLMPPGGHFEPREPAA